MRTPCPQVEAFTLSAAFNGVIIAIILLAAVVVGLQTYEGLSTNATIVAIDVVILGIFSAEVVAKLLAEGLEPWRYFVGN